MGSSRARNSTRARKARSVKRYTKAPKPLSNAAMARRLAKRKPGPDLGTAAVDIIRAHRDGEDIRPLEAIGAELRNVATRLERVESYLIVAGLALEGNAGYNGYIRVLLRVAVGNLLFKQIRALEDLAAQCDGGPASERDHEDDPDEDDDMDARGDE
jgi:hypothetical protein